MRVPIKPLSVNEAWQGRRKKTFKYMRYQKDVLMLLRPFTVPDGDLRIELVFGFSSKGSDWDNSVKPFQDILSKKYGFNDNRIVDAHVKKIKVKKGQEFIEWRLYAAEDIEAK
jgi:Holliday junction resolvase RusA-like endonuclease